MLAIALARVILPTKY